MKKLLLILLIVSFNTYGLTASQAAKTAVKMASSYIPFTVDHLTITDMYSINDTIVHKVIFHDVDRDLISGYRKLFGIEGAKSFIELQSRSQGMSAAADMCISDEGFKEALDIGVFMIYQYYDNDENFLYKYSFDKSVCSNIEKDYKALEKRIDQIWESR